MTGPLPLDAQLPAALSSGTCYASDFQVTPFLAVCHKSPVSIVPNQDEIGRVVDPGASPLEAPSLTSPLVVQLVNRLVAAAWMRVYVWPD